MLIYIRAKLAKYLLKAIILASATLANLPL
jgi:hypothetical protein